MDITSPIVRCEIPHTTPCSKAPVAVGLLTRAVRHDDVAAARVGHEVETLLRGADADPHCGVGTVILQGGLRWTMELVKYLSGSSQGMDGLLGVAEIIINI